MVTVHIVPSIVHATRAPGAWLGFALDVDQFHGERTETVLDALIDPTVLRLVRALQPQVLRIGGGGIEQTYLSLDGVTTGKRSDPSTYPMKDIPPVELTAEKLDGIAGFCAAIDVDLIQSFPMRYEEDLDTAQRLLAYLRHQTPVRMPYLEMSNEPEYCWFGQQERYPELVRRFHAALSPDHPDATWLAGYGGQSFPYSPGGPDNERSYLALMDAAGDCIDVYTGHFYACSSSRRYADQAFLMEPRAADIATGRIDELQMMLRMAGQGDKGIAVNEFNSMARKGADGISNTTAAALHLADFLGHLARTPARLNCLQAGVAGRHCNQEFWRYAMIDVRGEKPRVHPHYFAYQLWSRCLGPQAIGIVHDGDHRLAIHATRDEQGNVQSMLVNKDPNHSRDIDLRLVDHHCTGPLRALTLSGDGWSDPHLRCNGAVVHPEEDPAAYPWRDLDAPRCTLPPASLTVVDWLANA